MTTYVFRDATRHDLPLLRTWLAMPDVVAWWGNSEEQYAIVADDIRGSAMTTLMVLADGVPFAYAQHCEVHAWPQAHFAALPWGTRAVDAFIGEPAMLGCGHGSRFLRALAQRLVRDGAPLVVIDPDVENLRARRAYFNAGFRGETIVESDEGPAVLMIFDASASDAATRRCS